ncbi:unnamed protein product [Owenia fusiformis]|uniref:Ion transport domain-containing protein n=1 Tax=Owenia fusiformis TaxID=6347 RepID=A0A8S4NR43_OWEFU|nr:unnamed protein product [Owenia fusiformis]
MKCLGYKHSGINCFSLSGKMGNLCNIGAPDPDNAWKAQNAEMMDNLVYHYVNLAGGGKLVDAYIEYGESAAVRMIVDEIEFYLYSHGKGYHIAKNDFARWKYKMLNKVKGSSIVDTRTDAEVLAEFQEDEFNKFHEHDACWDLNKRGAVGETALHLCFLKSNDSPVHLDIANILLKLYPKLALDIYEGEEYFGESCLHIAIVYGDVKSVLLLLKYGANVNQRATGRFFLPEDQKRKNKAKETNYNGYAYFGEYPLAFAACFGHEAIYDHLIHHGADPDLQDSFGNTVLHMLVIQNQSGMYRYAVKHHTKAANPNIKNIYNMTPLQLASKLGRNKIFNEMMELSSVEVWRYSNITCSKYPLDAIDTIKEDGKTNWNSALMLILKGETDEHLEMLTGGVIKQLLDEKWKTYAQSEFIKRLIVTIINIMVISLVVYTRPDSVELNYGVSPLDIVRYIAEIIVCLGCLSTFLLQIEEIYAQGLVAFMKNLASAPAKSIFMVSCLLILLCVPMRFLEMRNAEDTLLALAVPGSWTYLLFYARSSTLFGPFVIMIYKMCATDMVRFGIIYAIFMSMFTQGFYFLFKDINVAGNPSVSTDFTSPDIAFLTLFQMTLGEFKYEEFGKTRHPILTKALFTVFAFLVPILLLNMLIAMMGNTYQTIISKSEKEWRRQWAQIVVVLERSFSQSKLAKYQDSYAVRMSTNTPALMVIKASNKTRARQRKGAVSAWKLAYKLVKKMNKEKQAKGINGVLDLESDFVRGEIQRQQMRRRAGSMFGDDAGFGDLMSQLAFVKNVNLDVGMNNNNRGDSIENTDTTLLDEQEDNTNEQISNHSTPKKTKKSQSKSILNLSSPSKTSLDRVPLLPLGNKRESQDGFDNPLFDNDIIMHKADRGERVELVDLPHTVRNGSLKNPSNHGANSASKPTSRISSIALELDDRDQTGSSRPMTRKSTRAGMDTFREVELADASVPAPKQTKPGSGGSNGSGGKRKKKSNAVDVANQNIPKFPSTEL